MPRDRSRSASPRARDSYRRRETSRERDYSRRDNKPSRYADDSDDERDRRKRQPGDSREPERSPRRRERSRSRDGDRKEKKYAAIRFYYFKQLTYLTTGARETSLTNVRLERLKRRGSRRKKKLVRLRS